ncbi:MAG: cell division protein, partial [Alcaligenaceae bacterium]|nr:cell division protein [Alcaligenaceae bacterium]
MSKSAMLDAPELIHPSIWRASRLIWIRTRHPADSLWAAMQVLRSGAFAGVLLWQTAVRAHDLRRLHLAAQTGDTLFALIRPAAFAGQASPAPLRLALHPMCGGIHVDVFKRQGRLP